METEEHLKKMLKYVNASKEALDTKECLFYEVNMIEVTMTYMKLQRTDKVTKYVKEIKERA